MADIKTENAMLAEVVEKSKGGEKCHETVDLETLGSNEKGRGILEVNPLAVSLWR